ncbi:MAG: hypothetical protein ABI879_05180 [Actinomycetota bacterium]
MGEFSRSSGGRLPNDPKMQAEHQHEVRDEIERSLEASEAARGNRAARPRPWWAFWRPRRAVR